MSHPIEFDGDWMGRDIGEKPGNRDDEALNADGFAWRP